MSSKRDEKYTRALDQLDAQRASGRVSQNAYDLQRAKLLKEAATEPWHWSVQVLVIFGVLVVFLIVLRVVLVFIGAMATS